ncbi:MAG TPA: DinB family protein [Nocardioidaceae bacterium]|nr:DinB family protein [Nocardioidaceae bacterium]
MTDTSRIGSALNLPERELLEAFLDQYRDELVRTLDGLTEEQARMRLVPSLTTPIALVKHAAAVERAWFQRSLAGRSADEIEGGADGSDVSFGVDDSDTVASVIAEFRAASAESRAIAASYTLDDQALHNRRGPLSVRWIYVHMIEELACHTGHGEILREQIDAGLTPGRDATA